MAFIIQISQFILIISILVILHELGHYIPAKLFKTKVEKFYLFFDYKFSLFKKKIGDTVYGVGWIPFGGYVKIAGMIDESMDTEQMKKPTQPWEFRSKPAWQRFIIMIGGVAVNFLLAWFIYTTLLVVNGDNYIANDKLEYGVYVDSIGEKLGIQKGDKIVSVDGKIIKEFNDVPIDILLGDKMTVNRQGKNITIILNDKNKKLVLNHQGKNFISPALLAELDSVVPNYSAAIAGLKKGDIVTAINQKPIKYWNELVSAIRYTKKDSLQLLVNRNNTLKTFQVHIPDSNRIGIAPNFKKLKTFYQKDNYSIFNAIPKGLSQTIDILVKQVKQFKLVFNKTTQGYKHVKGPIGIVEVMPKTWNWNFIWEFTAMFSVWLAFLNLLPIPALDGGHLVFITYEMISGRKPTQKILETAQIIGFFIIVTLMIIVFGNDIFNIFK
jgi:regulator of sigma E protease